MEHSSSSDTSLQTVLSAVASPALISQNTGAAPQTIHVSRQRLQAFRVSLAGLVLLFVASRLLYLVLIDPRYLLTYASDETYRGAIAQELVTGLSMPFTEYRADNYSGGSLVIGALAAGFFLLFGPTLFA